MFTPIWGNNKPLGQSPINIPNSSIGSTTTPAITTPSIKPFGSAPTPISGLGNIPIQDVFFSDQSFRAQLYRYLTGLQGTPWMFSYKKSEQKSLWDLLFKANEAVVIINPISDQDTQSEDQPQQEEQEQTEEQNSVDVATNDFRIEDAGDILIDDASAKEILKPKQTALKAGGTLPTFSLPLDPSLPAAMTLPEASQWMLSSDNNNPFSLILENAIEKSPEENTEIISEENSGDKPEVVQVASQNLTKKNTHQEVQLQQVFGQYLDNELYNQLTDAYEQSKESPDKCLWVRHIEDKVQVLGTEAPAKYGYKRVDYQWMGNLVNRLSPLAERYLDCTIGKSYVTCPNGGMIALNPYGWQDKDERVATIFQVKRLPNGKWFKITAIENETRVNLKDTEVIKKTLESWNQMLEATGWLRETAPLHPTQSTSPLL